MGSESTVTETDVVRLGEGVSLASAWEAIAETIPDEIAVVHGERRVTWQEFEDSAARVAQTMSDHGVDSSGNVAMYMRNCPEYLIGSFAAFKLRCAPVNVNYRYLDEELTYLLDNSEAAVVIVAQEFLDRVIGIKDQLPRVRLIICVDGATDPAHGVVSFDDAQRNERAAVIDRSGRDLWLLYTGGTTGNPKGVMWPHSSLIRAAKNTFAVVGAAPPETPAEAADTAREFAERNKRITLLPAAPLMHGTASITSIAVLSAGGTIVTMPGERFDADALCRTIRDEHVSQLIIVGDAFAKPIVEACERAAASDRPHDLSSLRVVLSSGVMWSQTVKEAFLQWTNATLADAIGSSEGIGFATSVSRRGEVQQTGRFALGPDARVIRDDGSSVDRGTGERGMLAVSGPIPIGYYNDPVKSAATFKFIDGRYWSMPGDMATVDEDGTLHLLGRGSACINTGGEKVFVEEVEEALKTHPLIDDAYVVGVPHERFGQQIAAVVGRSSDDGAPRALEGVELDEIRTFVRAQLADYKAPRIVVSEPIILRGPNGKADYRWAHDRLVAQGQVEPNPQ